MENKIKSLIKKLTRLGYQVNSEEIKHKDPVCGMKASKGISSEYQEQRYYFCSAHCKEQFDADPAAYVYIYE